ncbi:hypothetical protein CANINC_004749 [Pichia inconspicua]|uniref:tRNA-splicing endonuclease subunit Sen2 n=1 Tax=Pichia inconspicua TaxID=52247 RepID=A0A4T0WV70_9ASCO|nr:hypothetical protein CANINC_004749 [[Candida] inconspicua]
MSKNRRRDYINKKYVRPLPIAIPLLHVSNNYFTPYEVWESIYDTTTHIVKLGFQRNIPVRVIFDIYTDLSFKILDRDDMMKIWNGGFYGKGILSRSEPTWFDRMDKKIKKLLPSMLESDEFTKIKINDELFSEEVTKNRRELRDLWKRERKKYLKLEKNIKLESIDGEISNFHRTLLEKEREKLAQLKEEFTKGPKGVNLEILRSQNNSPLSSSTPINDTSTDKPETLRMEDFDVIIDSTNIRNIEYLELDPCEALFLLHLNLITVTINNETIPFSKLFQLLVETFGPILINEYVVYNHYRSLGWCIRNGLKFSCDWVLYSRGPPFSHAEFTVKVVNENDPIVSQTRSFTDYSAVSRVVTGVKKSLILCFVDGPEIESDDWFIVWNEYLADHDIYKLLNNFQINEIAWKRWAPSRTRM